MFSKSILVLAVGYTCIHYSSNIIIQILSYCLMNNIVQTSFFFCTNNNNLLINVCCLCYIFIDTEPKEIVGAMTKLFNISMRCSK